MLKVANTSIMRTAALEFFYVMIIKKIIYLNVLFTYIVINTIGEFIPHSKRRFKPPLVTLLHRQFMLKMEFS